MIRPCRAIPVVAAAALLGVAAGGCGEKSEDVATSSASGATVNVSETEFKIDPAAPRIEKPGRIAFEVKNDGKVNHAIEIELPDGEIDTDSIPPGESETIKADLKPGTYRWYCPLADHEERGMEGEIVVGDAGSGGDDDGGGSSGGGGGGRGY